MSTEEWLSKDDILGLDDVPVEEVAVPQWGGRKVLVSGFTAAGWNAYEMSVSELKGGARKAKLENATAKLVQRTLVDRNRQLLFTESDVVKLGTKSSAALEFLAGVALRLSGRGTKEMEELVKNSDAAQSGDSPTVSL